MGAVRVDVNGEVKFFENSIFFYFIIIFFWGGGGQVGVGGQVEGGFRVDVNAMLGVGGDVG